MTALTNGGSIIILPLGNDLPWYTFSISLTGVQYTIRMRYNTRAQRWIMDIADGQNNDIIDSIPLLIGRNLVGRFNSDSLPGGEFFVTDDTGAGNQPTQYSFATTHSLWYYDPTGVT